MTETDPIPLSALQHWAYCPRQCGLIHLSLRLGATVHLGNMSSMEAKTRFDVNDAEQGIVHAIGPELGLTQPGVLLACGDSHTSAHGALGALAWSIGSSEVVHVLATQTIVHKRPRRMLDPKHPTKVPALECALAALGRRAEIEVNCVSLPLCGHREIYWNASIHTVFGHIRFKNDPALIGEDPAATCKRCSRWWRKAKSPTFFIFS